MPLPPLVATIDFALAIIGMELVLLLLVSLRRSSSRRLALLLTVLSGLGLLLALRALAAAAALLLALAALARVLEGSFQIEERMLLEGSVWRGDQKMYSASALNDVVLNRAGRGGMIEVRVELDGAFMYTQRADGLIIATPTGSTAYALSANGPILHPGMNAMVLVPVAPQTLSNRPIVIPDSGVLNMTLTAMGRVEVGASVHFDMQTWSDLQPGDRIVVQRAPYTIRFVHPEGYSFFSTLRRKLHWNLMPEASDNVE